MLKKIGFPLLVAAGLGVGCWLSPLLAAPPAPPSDDSAFVAELTTQQAQLISNQAAIDAALAEVAEELRQARIFSSRSGGKVKIP